MLQLNLGIIFFFGIAIIGLILFFRRKSNNALKKNQMVVSIIFTIVGIAGTIITIALNINHIIQQTASTGTGQAKIQADVSIERMEGDLHIGDTTNNYYDTAVSSTPTEPIIREDYVDNSFYAQLEINVNEYAGAVVHDNIPPNEIFQHKNILLEYTFGTTQAPSQWPDDFSISLTKDNTQIELYLNEVSAQGGITTYKCENLQSGIYLLEITAEGFEPYKSEILLCPENAFELDSTQHAWQVSADLLPVDTITVEMTLDFEDSEGNVFPVGTNFFVGIKGGMSYIVATVSDVNGRAENRYRFLVGRTYEVLPYRGSEGISGEFDVNSGLSGVSVRIQ